MEIAGSFGQERLINEENRERSDEHRGIGLEFGSQDKSKLSVGIRSQPVLVNDQSPISHRHKPKLPDSSSLARHDIGHKKSTKK